MAAKKFILALGDTPAHPVGDKAGWLADHAWADLDNVGTFASGTNLNTFSMPAGTWPLHAQMQQQGVAIPGIRYLVSYNPTVTGWLSYPMKGRFLSADIGGGPADTETFIVEPILADVGLMDDTTVVRDRTGLSFNVDTQASTVTFRLERITPLPTPPPPAPLTNPPLMEPPVEIGEQYTYQLKTGIVEGEAVTFDNTTNIVLLTAHGLAEFTRITFSLGAGGAMPTGLSTGIDYYVRNPNANDFQLALDDNPASPVVTFTSNGTPIVNLHSSFRHVDVPQTFLRFVAGGEIGQLSGMQIRKVGPAVGGSNIPIGESRIIERLWWTDEYSATGKPSRLLTSVDWPALPHIDDLWELEPQGAVVGATVPFDQWAYFLPWSPYEGKDQVYAQKFNPYPPGFNAPSHVSIPHKFDSGAGPRLIEDRATWHPGLAMRIREAVGEDIYVVPLGVPESTLAAREKPVSPEPAWLSNVGGWFDKNGSLSWSPAMPNGLFSRLSILLDVAKAAAALEGNTLECIGIPASFGYNEYAVGGAVDQFESNLRTFRTKVRQLLQDKGMLPAGTTGDQVPFLMGGVPTFVSGYAKLNAAIANVMRGDSYSETFDFLTASQDDTAGFAGGITGADMTAYENGLFAGWQALTGAQCATPTPSITEVDICNLALSYVGDTAKITAIDGTDLSAQATHCRRFYPIARDSMLEQDSWAFTMRRVKGNAVANVSTQWAYAYEYPCDALKVMAVVPASSTDDYAETFVQDRWATDASVGTAAGYVPRKFTVEALGGQKVVYSDEPEAVIRYSSRVTDPSQFSRQFINALSWQLASMLAGPIVKGSEGAALGQRATQMANFHLSRASTNDGDEHQTKPEHRVDYLDAR